MSNVKMLGGRIPSDLKDYFDEEALGRGLTQAQLLEEIVEFYFDNEAIRQVDDEMDEREEPEPTLREDGDLFDLFPHPLAKDINCAIVMAIRKVDFQNDPYPVSTLLLELSEILSEQADLPRPLNCFGEDYRDFILPEGRKELDRILRGVSEDLYQSEDRNLVLKTIAQYCVLQSENIYRMNRTLFLTFSREEWVGLDKLVEQANKDRQKDQTRLSLEDIIKIKLGEQMEEMGQGFFGPRDRQLYELGKAMQVV